MANEVPDDPATIVFFGGTSATEPFTASETDVLIATRPVIRTVPNEELPPETAEGLIVSESSMGASTPKLAPRTDPGTPADSDTVVGTSTGMVVIGNDTKEPPWGTVTEDGSATDCKLVERTT